MSKMIIDIRRQMPTATPHALVRDTIFSAFSSRGVPTLDIFIEVVLSRFRIEMMHSPVVTGITRSLLIIREVESANVKVTIWVPEPVVSSMIITSSTSDLRACERHLRRVHTQLRPVDSSASTKIEPSIMMGRWAGWIAHEHGKADPSWDSFPARERGRKQGAPGHPCRRRRHPPLARPWTQASSSCGKQPYRLQHHLQRPLRRVVRVGATCTTRTDGASSGAE